MKINEIAENISHTSKRIHDIEREKNVEPGTPEWFKLWFSLPYLKESMNHSDGEDIQEQGVKQSNPILVLDKIADRKDGKPFPVKFYDGSLILVTPKNAKLFMNVYYRMDSAQKDVIHQYIRSKKGFMQAITDMNITETTDENGIEVNLYGDAKKGYSLSKIKVPDELRNSGAGTQAMQDIVDRMDREGAIIVLTPDDAFGGNKNRLIKFYKRFGFVPNKGRNKDFRFRETMIRYPQTNEGINEGYKLQLERDTDMMVLNITDTVTGKRTEVRGKAGYETNNYDANDKLHKLLDKISKSANISELMNGEVVGINPKHPDGPSAKTATTTAFNESFDNPYPFNFTGPNTDNTYFAKAQTPNGELVMEFDGGYDDFSIDFAIGNEMGKTDAGDQFRVFATVVAMMNKWISVVGIEHVEAFDFAANKEEHASDGRARLYSRFAKKLAAQLGWSLQQSSTGNDTTEFFNLVNPKPVERPDGYFDAIDDGNLGPNGEIPAEYTESVVEAEDTLTLPKISVGDEVMVGKFKNRKAEVKGFSKDDHNQPVLKTTKGDQKLFKPRLSKLMKEL